MGISWSPSCSLRSPSSIFSSFFVTINCFLSTSMSQSSSQSWPSAISEEFFKLGSVIALFASRDNLSDNGSCPLPVEVRVVLSSWSAVGPLLWTMSLRMCWSSARQWCCVAPLSPLKITLYLLVNLICDFINVLICTVVVLLFIWSWIVAHPFMQTKLLQLLSTILNCHR